MSKAILTDEQKDQFRDKVKEQVEKMNAEVNEEEVTYRRWKERLRSKRKV